MGIHYSCRQILERESNRNFQLHWHGTARDGARREGEFRRAPHLFRVTVVSFSVPAKALKIPGSKVPTCCVSDSVIVILFSISSVHNYVLRSITLILLVV